MIEANVPVPQPTVEYIEIDDESEDFDPNEELKNEV